MPNSKFQRKYSQSAEEYDFFILSTRAAQAENGRFWNMLITLPVGRFAGERVPTILDPLHGGRSKGTIAGVFPRCNCFVLTTVADCCCLVVVIGYGS